LRGRLYRPVSWSARAAPHLLEKFKVASFDEAANMSIPHIYPRREHHGTYTPGPCNAGPVRSSGSPAAGFTLCVTTGMKRAIVP
jgi:hypothetical protein